MPVALDALLADPALALELAVGDATGVEVTWAHAIELEDPTAWLSGGELILTTGLRLPRSGVEQTAYARRMHRAGVAALGFGVGVRYAAIPRGLVEECRRLGLPLLEVPLPTPFLAVTQAVARALADEQHRALQGALDFQRQVTGAALDGGLESVTHTLAHRLGAAVLVLDGSGRAIARSNAPAGLLARVRTELPSTGGDSPTARRVDVRGEVLELQSLRAGGRLLGWVALQTPDAVTTAQRVLVNQALGVLTLLLDRPRELRRSRRSVGSAVLSLLLDGRPEATTHLALHGIPTGEPLVVASVEGPERLRTLADRLADRLDEAGHPHLMLVPGEDDDAGAPVLVLLRASAAHPAVAHLRGGLDAIGLRESVVGVSAPVVADAVPQARITARQAAASAARRHQGVGWFDQLTLESVIAEPSLRERISALAAPALAGLADEPGLLESLRAYLEHNGAWGPASTALGVHRHTLRARMDRVQRITGLDLEVAQNRVVLLLALMTR